MGDEQISLGLNCAEVKKETPYKSKDYSKVTLEDLRKEKLSYLKRIDNLFKPVSQMSKAEINFIIKNPHYNSKKAAEYYQEISAIEEFERELVWVSFKRKANRKMEL